MNNLQSQDIHHTIHPKVDDALKGKWEDYHHNTNTLERAQMALHSIASGESLYVPMEFRVSPDSPLGAPHPLYDALALIDAIQQDRLIKTEYERARADSVQLSALTGEERQVIMDKSDTSQSRMYEAKIQQLQDRWIDRLTDGKEMVDVLYLTEVGNMKGLANLAVGYENEFIRDIHHAKIEIHHVEPLHDDYLEALQTYPGDEIVMPAEAHGTISMERANGCRETYHFTFERDALGMMQMGGDKHFEEFCRTIANGSVYTERENKVNAFTYMVDTLEYLAEREINQQVITPVPEQPVTDYPYEYFTRT